MTEFISYWFTNCYLTQP